MKKILSTMTCLFMATTLYAGDIKPALLFDTGGKFDKGFNEGAYNGAEKFKAETGISYSEFEIRQQAESIQAVQRMASRGKNPVIGLGAGHISGIAAGAAKYPDTSFVLVGFAVDAPNVQSILFENHTGSFLVGMLAAMKSNTDTIGFVGGMDIGPIRDFACGYEQGAKYVNPNAKVVANYVGMDGSAWNNPTRGAELTQAQIQKGAEVVYAVAGGTNMGIFQAAKDAKKYAIGVSVNQNHLFPGTILTSMIASSEAAVYHALKEAQAGGLKHGIKNIGLATGAVGWSLDEHNKGLITDEMKAKVDQAQQDIIDGKIKVLSYLTNNNCEY